MALVLTASCDRKLEFQHETFATFDAVSFSVDETVGQVTVPVSIYNPTGSEIQVTVKAVDGKGVAGVDYEIVTPSSGILTFSGDVTTQNVVVAITDYSGEFTGAKDFSLKLESATAGVGVGNYNTARFTVKDLDHPLSLFIGNWSGSILSYFDGGNIPINFTIAANEEDETFSSLIISDLDPALVSYGYTAANGYNMYLGTVNAEKNKITVAAGQETGLTGYVIVGFDTDSIETATAFVDLVIDYVDGKLVINQGWGSTDGTGYWGGIYFGGAELTKK